MSLYRRLHEVQQAPASGSAASHRDPVLAEMRHKIHQRLIDELGPILYDNRLEPEELRKRVHEQLQAALALERAPLSAADKAQLIQDVSDDILGYGPIDKLLKDPEITEIMCNGPDSVYVERKGKLVKDATTFVDAQHLRRIIDKIVSQVGRRIDEAAPMVDARLADGSRINAVIPPLAIDGPLLTVRKFSQKALSIDDLVALGTLTRRLAAFFDMCVKAKVSIIVTGGTGTGKTTLLNALSGFLPEQERIVTIEDAAELHLQQRHRVRLEARPPNIEGRGVVTIRDLVRNALRMRPDRIIVGEVRGPEALDMLQAMNTGHEGSLTTLHANSPRDGLARLETMVLMAGLELPLGAVREQIASAIDLVIHLERLNDGSRRVIEVSDVAGMEGNVIMLNSIYAFDFAAGIDANGHHVGTIEPSGIRPTFERKLRRSGLELPPDTFSTDAQRLRASRGAR